MSENSDFLYLRVAERLEKLITQGVLKTGDKLLSVRALSKEQGISMSTAYKAYAHIENKGWIEARPKSGYYVRFTPSRYPPIPKALPLVALQDANVETMLTAMHNNLSQEGMVRLSQATPSIELLPGKRLSKTMAEVVRNRVDYGTGYESLQGNESLRRQIARYAFNWGGTINEGEVITTQGCMEALVLCLKAVTKPGDVVAIESPTFFNIFNVIHSLGLTVLEIPTHPHTGPDLDYLEHALAKVPVSACLFITNFSNPTGYCMPNESKKRLVELLALREIPLIEDDIYGELYFGKTRPRTCKSYDRNGLVLLCSSISKSLAPGYRVGWCIPGQFAHKVLHLKLINTISSATPTQAAVGLFFETGRFDLHMRHLRKALHMQSLLYLQAIAEFFPEDTKVTQPQGGYVLWLELHKNVDAFALFQSALRHQIGIAPGPLFSARAHYTNYIRLSFGAPFTSTIEKSLRTVGKLVRDHARGNVTA